MRIESKIGTDADDFARRIEDAEMHLEMTAHTKTGKAVLVHEVKDLFIVTESSVYCAGEGNIKLKEPSFRIRSTEFANGIQRDTVHDYSLRGVDPYIAETSLHLGLHPSKLALTPAVAHDHLASFAAASALAHGWGSELVALGAVGHLNPASGFGPWPQAEAFIQRLDQPNLQ